MWDERYAEPGFAYGTAPNDFLVQEAARMPAGGRVLEIASGEGRNAVWLAEQGFDVVAVDGSAVGVEKTRRLAAERGVNLSAEVADLARYAVEPGGYDGVVSIFAHLPPPVRAAVHAQVVAALRPGGALVLEAYTPAQLALKTGGPPTAEMLYTLEALREELPGLVFEHAEELERDVIEGRYHTGRAAVVQLVARRP